VSDDLAAPAAGAPPVPDVSPWRLIGVLAGGGAFAGLLLVVVFLATKDAIAHHKAQVLEDTVREVLGAPDRVETLWLRDGRLTPEAPADPRGVERIWRGSRADGTAIGVAIEAKGVGFADDVRLLFGWDPSSGRILAFRVIENKETPGLGDGIVRNEAFVDGFRGAKPPLQGVKAAVRADPDAGEVHTITGATVSSRAVIRIVNRAVERWKPLLAPGGGEGVR
jgi:electron transport complex protein RnfG